MTGKEREILIPPNLFGKPRKKCAKQSCAVYYSNEKTRRVHY